MIIPGVLSQQALLSSAGGPGRPVILQSVGATSSSGTSHEIAIASGWAPGDLSIVCMALSASNTLAANSSGMTGWTRLTRANTSGVVLTGEIWWKILQSGDANPTYLTNAAGFLSSRQMLIQAGTFNDAAPLVLASSGGSGTSTSATVSASSTSYDTLPWTQIDVLFRRGVSSNASVTSYPLSDNNGFSATGTGSGCGICSAEHNGGATPAGAWGLSAESGWRTPVLLVSPSI